MTDLRPTIVPKSDQLNADDLIGRTLTVKVQKVALTEGADQPIAIHFEGDGGKPYLPCKSMRRVMVQVWGPDGNKFVGRRMTLYRDDKVQFGGMAVGGIRISHMSDIDNPVTMALTATRANRKPYTVRPLPPEEKAKPQLPETTLTLEQRTDAYLKRVEAAPNATKLGAIGRAAAGLMNDLDAADPERGVEVQAFFDARMAELETSPDEVEA